MAATLVHALKYGRWKELARPMGRAMVEPARRLCRREANAPDLVPVPLAPARRRDRGFNQAHHLARSLAELTGWPLVPCLERRGGGRRQARLDRRGRLGNAMDRFHVPEPSRHGISRPARAVLIVDDVVTTGSTAAACARALTQAGSRPVGVVSFARALRPLDGR
ncbi:MAG: ComF family protein [Gemmatimonadota bacterium]